MKSSIWNAWETRDLQIARTILITAIQKGLDIDQIITQITLAVDARVPITEQKTSLADNNTNEYCPSCGSILVLWPVASQAVGATVLGCRACMYSRLGG